MSVPRSDYLRNALEARRAQNSPVPKSPKTLPIDPLPSRHTPPIPSNLQAPALSPDAFDEFDLPEELMAPESPIRRRRPNEPESTPPRGKTNHELSREVETLKDELIKQNIRVELLKKSNHELQTKWLRAKEDAEQLKPLQDEVHELRQENKALCEKLDSLRDYEDQLDDLSREVDKLWSERTAVDKANTALKNEVLNLTKVTNEAVTSMQDQQGAFDEAVEMITVLDNEKLLLKKEVGDLKARVAAIESKQLDGSAQYPQRIFNVDEARPVTSYDDSDYYSQPATPGRERDRDAVSVRSGASVQSRRFIEMSKERTRSARNLSKRLSDASLRATSVVSTVQVPEVPHIPEEITPRMVDDRFRERRYHQEPNVEYHIARSGAEVRRPATVAPVQTHQPSGLRSVHRPEYLQRSSTSRPSTSHGSSSSKTSAPRARTHSLVETSPAAPPRMSSRRAYTTNDDGLQPQTSDDTLDSNTTTGTIVGSDGRKQEQVLTTWNSPHPCSSSISLLTTSPQIDRERPDKERWWKDTEHVKPLRTRATTRTLKGGFTSADGGTASKTFAARASWAREHSTTELPVDFVFSPSESEEEVMSKKDAQPKTGVKPTSSVWRRNRTD